MLWREPSAPLPSGHDPHPPGLIGSTALRSVAVTALLYTCYQNCFHHLQWKNLNPHASWLNPFINFGQFSSPQNKAG